MLACLLSAALCSREKPIVFFPALFGSVLYGTITNLKSEHWFCPRNIKDLWIWENDEFLIPPLTDCLADYLRCAWNETTQRPGSRPEAEIYNIDFGGVQGIRYLDRGIFGYHFTFSLDDIITRFEAGGYTAKIDMYGAPYDWRMNPVALDDFFERAKELIELVNLQCQHKPTVFGYSAGCYALHTFLTSGVVDQKWKDTYIDKLVMVAPSYGGTPFTFPSAMAQMSWFPGAGSESMKMFYMSLPILYAHMPNWVVYRDKPIVIGPDGTKYYPHQLRELLYEIGSVPEEFKPIYDYTERRILNQSIEDTGCDTIFVVNTGIKTEVTFEFNETWGNVSRTVEEEGDAVLNKDTLYWGLNNWRSGHSIVVQDYVVANMSWNHGSMLDIPEIQNDIFDFVVQDDWRRPGNWLHIGLRNESWLDHMVRV